MSKVKEIIDLYDTDRIGNDAEFHYLTPEMDDSAEPRKFLVTSDELCEFIEENCLNEFQTDVDEFREYDSHDYLMDNWEEVKEKYWLAEGQARVEQNYKDAVAYLQSFIKKAGHPLTNEELNSVNQRMVSLYGIQFGKEAA